MPWGRLDDSLYDHPKLDELPVEHRLEAIGLWARSISWCNRFLTDGHVPRERIAKLDGSIPLADMLVSAGLYDLNGTGFIVHDFLEFNDSRAQVLERREADAARQREWREKKRKSRNGVTDSVTANGNGPNVTPGVTASVTGGVTASSRARDVARIPARPGPSRPNESLHEEKRARPSGREDVAELRRRLGRVTKAQRAVLDEILGRHDVTGPAFAVEAMRAAPEGTDPLEAVMAADRLWQEAQRKRVDQEERAAEKRKADDAASPPW